MHADFPSWSWNLPGLHFLHEVWVSTAKAAADRVAHIDVGVLAVADGGIGGHAICGVKKLASGGHTKHRIYTTFAHFSRILYVVTN